ncbi:hypothetical protein GCM10022220_72290 [Actinocatenispora rupis]|uniref:Adenosylcobinamide kinase n=1 Tax=Actinocatenispora rupis TaxID=519421 RepID=A0A8J3ITK8_9ACTN|nr:hypothetical protein Aru02nite_05750 [Actinocatenispora rupis]
MAPVTDAHRVLVLGGISSGKSRFAERLAADGSADRHYLATGRENPDDPDWQRRIETHREQRGDGWTTAECGADPDALRTALAEVPAGSAVLVDDLGGWVGLLLERDGDDTDRYALAADVAALAEAVRDSPAARVVLVSPEVGLSVVPESRSGRLFADVLGDVNRAVAEVCDRVALVVAGRAVWLPTDATVPADGAAAPVAAEAVAAVAVPDTGAEVAEEPEDIGPAQPDDDIAAIRPPDRIAINAAQDRLVALASGGAGLGALAEPVAWAVGATGRPGPWTSIRLVLVGADHAGGASAGSTVAADKLAAIESGDAPLARLAERTGATLTVADLAAEGLTAPAPAMERADVLTAEQVDAAFALGRRLAETAADEGADVLVPAAYGAGVRTAAAAVLAAATGAEPAGLLDRVVGTAGRIDDDAWIARAVAARDALHRVRLRSRDTRSLLAMLGGPDLAVLTGLIVGAAVRRTPVLVDNPATATAMILARDLAPSSPWWCLVPDHGRQPAVQHVCDLLGFEPFLDLGLGLGDGCTALTAVGVLAPHLALAATLDDEPVHA